ncbi:MAG: GTPase ObgE [Anaeromyxobacter sp.]|nr:GTPase ObgE [Anaeromyxobacter sp.]
MKFVDEVRIHVKAGDGGAGCIAWRREKFIPRGGPAGGDGGDGGDVVLVVDPQMSTLLDYRFIRERKAKSGETGHGRDMNGLSGPHLELKVPQGTVVRDATSGEVIVDMSQVTERFVIAKGGRGGLGNLNYATSTNQAPRFAQDGTKGEEKELFLELKLLADVGIVGFPNAGKSTLISRISKARPKIADYPFTTLTPNLGVASWRGERSFVVADIPGLIEGAHTGAGLGHQFLRHVERCRVLVHLVEGANPEPGRTPARDFAGINRELALYSKELATKPQVVVVTKVDLPEARAAGLAWQKVMARRVVPVPVLLLSSATGEGLDALLDAVAGEIWPEVSPRRSARPRKAGRPRAGAVEEAPPRAAVQAPAPRKAVAAKAARKPAPKAAPKAAAPRKKPAPRKAGGTQAAGTKAAPRRAAGKTPAGKKAGAPRGRR